MVLPSGGPPPPIFGGEERLVGCKFYFPFPPVNRNPAPYPSATFMYPPIPISRIRSAFSSLSPLFFDAMQISRGKIGGGRVTFYYPLSLRFAPVSCSLLFVFPRWTAKKCRNRPWCPTLFSLKYDDLTELTFFIFFYKQYCFVKIYSILI